MILVDTSIWGRLADSDDPLYGQAKSAFQKVLRNSMGPAIAAQSLYEFWVVATRPTANNGLAWTPERATVWITKLQRSCFFIPEDPRTFQIWQNLVTTYNTSGKAAHDARLVAVMQLHGINSILTFNVKDFARYDVTIIDPKIFPTL
ncbi:MAG TPA: type II toxin-antitoxin system VapC family toxin [Phycisphaerae bacterium]|nr:type II toxin-antitoxin system VapC family toxin [Phycisphaerae bacterium]